LLQHIFRWKDKKVDWKRLVQFALLGSSDVEQYAVLLVRVSLGLFFAISGANKLFVAGSRRTMYETLVEAKVPFPHLMSLFCVPGHDGVPLTFCNFGCHLGAEQPLLAFSPRLNQGETSYSLEDLAA
jgi:hypothetical protein